MIKSLFVLKEPNIKEDTLIYSVIRYGDIKLKLSTKIKIKPEYWSQEKQKIKQTLKVSNFNELNKYLIEYKASLDEVYINFVNRYNRQPNREEFKKVFNLEFFKKIPQFVKPIDKTIFDLFNDYISTIKSSVSESTILKYKQSQSNFVQFEKLLGKNYNVDMLDLEFRNLYLNFLITEMNYKPTTIYRKLKFLKTVLQFAKEQGENVHSFVFSRRFLTKDEEVDNIALTEIELAEFEGLDLANDKKLDQVRDLFLVGCYTGQRFSDIHKINRLNVIDNKYISFRQKKTNEPITLPILDNLRNILIKYDFNLPKISNQKFNEYIKEVARMCDLMNVEVNKDFKYNLIKSHTARRTFVTMNYSKGIELKVLSIATGHKSTKTLNSYIKMNDRQKADLLRSKLEG